MNDMILNLLANDSFTVSDFKAVGLTAENTKLESEERYKQSEMIRNNPKFQENGEFSDDKFHQYYLQATAFYNNFADDTYIEDITKNTFYSKENVFAPAGSHKKDEAPKFITSPNPFLQTNSITRVGKKGDRTLSIAEIAQKQTIYDSNKQEFLNETVNDRAFGNNPFKWLGDLFSEPLVIAQWDEDGEHIDLLTGETKKHKKGDYKYNSDGTFYYETLNGRDIYGRQVLNRMNTLTVDGSKANKYDFFDSDDLEQKSFIGTTLKNLALVGSMFLPVVGKPIIAANVAAQSVGLLGALGKMFLGSESETTNNMHAWAKTVSRQTATEYASQNTWCWENLINMIGDTVGQLAEQRFIFTHVPALLKGTKGIKAGKGDASYKALAEAEANKIKQATNKDLLLAIEKEKTKGTTNALEELLELEAQHEALATIKAQAALEKYMESYHKLGSIMSKAYMTGITVQDTYGEAKANGASDMEALALTLGYAAGEAWILNTGLGEWIIPEAHGDKLKYRALVNAVKKDVKEITSDATKTATKEGRQNVFKEIFNLGKKIATNDYALSNYASGMYSPMQVVLAHAAGEGFEEVSEEVLADISKSAFNVVNWLRGDETRIEGAWEDIGNRYGMSLLGGFLGGGISSASTDFSQAKQLANMTNETAMQEIVYMINNGKIDDFLKYVNKADLGNKYLSFDTDENGNFKAGTKDNNQDADIKKALNLQIKVIRDTINAEGAKFSENALFDAVTLKDLRYLQLRDTATMGALFQEYNSLVSQIVQKVEEIKQLTGETTNTDTKKKELNDSEQKELAKKKEELEELRVRKEAITSGKRAPEFIATALYEAQKALHGHKRGYIFQEWAEVKTGKKYEDLTSAEIESLKPLYKNYVKTEMKNDVIGDARQFVHLVGLASGAIQEQQEYITKMLEDGKQEVLALQKTLGNLYNEFGIAAQIADDGDLDEDVFIEKVQQKLDKLPATTSLVLSNQFMSQETLDRLNFIEAQPTDDVYTEDIKKLDKTATIFESFAEYVDTISQKFIDKGYIHSEVKNHLVSVYNTMINTLKAFRSVEEHSSEFNMGLLQSLSPYVGLSDEEVLNSNRSSILLSYIKNLENKRDQIKELRHTPIIDLLEKFKTATSTSDLSVRDVLSKLNDLLNGSALDITDFTFGDNFGEQLNEVDEVIDVLASALYATRADKSGLHNAWGYSKTLNELNKQYKNEQWTELAEIEGETADLLLQDLALIKQKVRFAKNLHRVNSGQKLTVQPKVGYNKQYIFANKLKRLLDQEPTRLQGWNLESIRKVFTQDLLMLKYNGVTHADRRLNLSPEEKVQFEREAMLLDDAIYQFFQDNKAKVNDVNELAKLFDSRVLNLYDPATALLNHETDDLDDGQFIFSLAARAAIKGSDFYKTYGNTFSDQKAPVPMQLQPIYNNVAMVLNGDVMNKFAQAYSTSLLNHFKSLSKEDRRTYLNKLEKSEQVISYYVDNPEALAGHHAVEKFANIILTEGIAGSGKTKGVFDSTKKIIEQVKPELLDKVFVVNATLENANGLMKDLGLKGKAFSTSHKETNHDLIRYFYSDYTPNYDGKVSVINGKVVTNFKLKEDLTDLPKIIFLDEASRYDYIQMHLLSKAAQHYGIAVLAAGDFDQISASTSVTYKENGKERKVHLSPHRLNFINSSKLGLSFRTLNSQMSKNQKEILAGLHDQNKDHFNIYYWEDDKEIRGFKNYKSKDLDGIFASIEKIKTSVVDGEKIGFLYADENSETYKKVKERYGDLIDGKSIEDAQGLEGDYYIIDINQVADDAQDVRQQIYTGLTRARKGGLIISDSKKDQLVYITNIQDQASELETISPKAIAKANKKLTEIYDIIFKDSEAAQIPYHEMTKVSYQRSNIEPVKEEDNDGIPPSEEPSTPNTVPEGQYKSEEDALNSVSMYKEGLELIDSDGNVIGTIVSVGANTVEDSEGNTWYAPNLVVETSDNNVSSLDVDSAKQYTLKNPSDQTPVAKYNVGDVFYDPEGNAVKITEVLSNIPVKYKVEKHTGEVVELAETDLNNYTTTPPVKKKLDDTSDAGENESEEIYAQRIAASNASNIPSQVTSTGSISHRLYTFNGYETGGVWNDDGTLNLEGNEFDAAVRQARIDNVNGLIKIGAFDPTKHTKAECLDILDDIHGILMTETDNSKVCSKVAGVLKIPNTIFGSIEYGIKSSAGYPNPEWETREFDVFGKHPKEKVEHTSSTSKADEISKKPIVAVFKDPDGKKILEITVGVLNSPITVGQITDDSGNPIYPEVKAILDTLTPGLTPEQTFEITWKAQQACKGQGYHYKDLETLFKAYHLTRNAYVPLRNADKSEFNLASQRSFGPNLVVEKGERQKDGSRQYKTKYMELDEFVKDKRRVVSDIWIPKDTVYAGASYPLHKGYPGVFVSYNTNYSKDDLPMIYLTQHAPDYKGPKDVEFYYVIPPQASVAEYLKNYRNVYINQTEGKNLPTSFIGNKWTAYKLLKGIKEQGNLTAEKLKSSSLDYVNFDDIVACVNELQAIESREDWGGDSEYNRLYSKYKSLGYSDRAAKTYAKRNVIIQKQEDILNTPYSTSGLPMYKVLTNYLANAVYWSTTTTKPDKTRLDIIEAANKGTIKYKVGYSDEINSGVGLFVRAKTSDNPYMLEAITTDGDYEYRSFLINDKIDPPIFEIPAINAALEVMADWTLENPNNPQSKKIFSPNLTATTRGYINYGRKKAEKITAFGILKKNNKILFSEGGLLHGIDVRGTDDPDLDQQHFASEILKEFNSKPNNLGFAVVNSNGNVKLHALKIDTLPRNVARPANETVGSLGGIIVGMPLIFTPDVKELSFTYEDKEYSVQINNKELIITPITVMSENAGVKVEVTQEGKPNEEQFKAGLDLLKADELFSSLEGLDNLTYTNVENWVTNPNLSDALNMLEFVSAPNNDPNAQAVLDYIFNLFKGSNSGVGINLSVGDIVRTSDGDLKVVTSIEGTTVTAQSLNSPSTITENIDISQTDLFRIDEQSIECVNPIIIKYGK